MPKILHERVPATETNEAVRDEGTGFNPGVEEELSKDIELGFHSSEEEQELVSLKPAQINSDRVSPMEPIKPFDVNDDPCIKRLNILTKLAFVIFCIASIISIIKLSTGYNLYNELYNELFFEEDTTMKKEDSWDVTEGNYSSLDPTMLEASLHSRAAYYRRHNPEPSPKCEDYEYGCCEIYDTCGTTDDVFTSTSLSLDPRVVHKHDVMGTNCPRFNDMISDYAEAYGSDTCENSEYGCCELNFVCDIRTYFQTYRNETDESTAHIYRVNIHHMSVMMSTDITKKDESGTNCPQPFNIIQAYEIGFRTEADAFEIALIFGICSIFLCISCLTDSSRKYR